MENIWGFLSGTLSVSFLALLILIIKKLLEDKLSPRWQYGVWGILALKILLPVSDKRFYLFPIPVFVEQIKTFVESRLNSEYSGKYVPVSQNWLLPLIHGKPESVTDWLFVIYAAGISVFLIYHLISYIALRFLLKKGEKVSDETQRKIDDVCRIYSFKPCKAVAVKGISSAFICGVFRPVLVFPAGRETDEKVILHELVHKKSLDAFGSIFWCILKAFHWCNPFMLYVFSRIGNDMEARCDQKVLELLKGEERREYGSILLSMANEKYARAVGTTSVSNGGKNISRRIASIVRFKKYPRGMALVSVCIAVILSFHSLIGASASTVYDSQDFYTPTNAFAFSLSTARSRIRRCTTVAGALDTYAKGLILHNGIYIATASPLSKQEAILSKLGNRFSIDLGDKLENTYTGAGYKIYNLAEKSDGSFDAVIIIPSGKAIDDNGVPLKEGGNPETANKDWYVAVFVSVKSENGFWVVEETKEREYCTLKFGDFIMPEESLDSIRTMTAESRWGTVTFNTQTSHTVDNRIVSQSNFSLLNEYTYSTEPKTGAKFETYMLIESVTWDYNIDKDDLKSVGICIIPVDSPDEEVTPRIPTLNSSGSSNDGSCWHSEEASCKTGEIKEWSYSENNPKDEMPVMYKVFLIADGEIIDELLIKEESK